MKNGEFKIETGIPIPSSAMKGISEAMKKMKVGDSILVEANAPQNLHGLAARQWGARCSAVRKVAAGKYRVWRIK